MASDDLARTFTDHLQGIEEVLRLVDAEERLHAEAVVDLQRRPESTPAAASPADWEQAQYAGSAPRRGADPPHQPARATWRSGGPFIS